MRWLERKHTRRLLGSIAQIAQQVCCSLLRTPANRRTAPQATYAPLGGRMLNSLMHSIVCPQLMKISIPNTAIWFAVHKLITSITSGNVKAGSPVRLLLTRAAIDGICSKSCVILLNDLGL